MIEVYRTAGGRLEATGSDLSDLERVVWIDLASPVAEDEARVEAALGVEVPTRDDMQEIEPSSRLYTDRGALYLTAQVLASHEPNAAEIAPVTFMLTKDRLVTVHYHKPGSITFFAEWAKTHDMGCLSGITTLMALLETMVDRLADVIEGEARKHDALTKAIFEAHRPSGKTSTLAAVLQRIGRAEDLNGKIVESLSTIARVLAYLSASTGGGTDAPRIDRAQITTLGGDVRSLQRAAEVQSRKILFQLDATLGVINIRQADIIKVFSVVAFVFLPPTLIASIYGMNFVHMPELAWRWGYPMAVGLMVLSAVIPWAIFRAKRWL